MEIKFRAFGVKSKVMLPVGELYFSQTGVRALGSGVHIEKSDLVSNDNIILMQYIGLHDRCNKEVYDGDIVKARFFTALGHASVPLIRTVKRYRMGWDFDPHLNGWPWQLSKEYQDHKIGDMEVIGNIYENPELVEN